MLYCLCIMFIVYISRTQDQKSRVTHCFNKCRRESNKCLFSTNIIISFANLNFKTFDLRLHEMNMNSRLELFEYTHACVCERH